jgi:hypothetical protein
MEYTDLKNGNIVVMTNEYVESRIIIVDRVEQSVTGVYKLYTYAELDIEYDDLFLEKYEPGCAYDVKHCSFRPAEEEEKIKLYHALGKEFTEEYDTDWYEHFTDSSYYDIQDFLFDVFCIKVEEYDNDLIYPDFVDDIQRYIWCKCCDAVGMPDGFNEDPDEKKVRLNDVCNVLCEMLYESDYNDVPTVTSSFETIEDFLEEFTKRIYKL